MKEYAVVYEHSKNNWSAYSPDVPGCIATGKTRDEVEQNFKDALTFHIEGLEKERLPIPKPAKEAEGVPDLRDVINRVKNSPAESIPTSDEIERIIEETRKGIKADFNISSQVSV